MRRQELVDICRKVVDFMDEGSPAKDVIENTAYTESEVLYQAALVVLAQDKTDKAKVKKR